MARLLEVRWCQVVDLGVEAGVSEDLDTDVTSMFGTVEGFKAESLPEKHTETTAVDDDF